MSGISEYIGFFLAILIPGAVFVLLISLIWRRIKGKNTFSPGTTFIGEHVYKFWEPGQSKTAVEEIQYQREDEREEAEPGDPPEPGVDDPT